MTKVKRGTLNRSYGYIIDHIKSVLIRFERRADVLTPTFLYFLNVDDIDEVHNWVKTQENI